MERVIRRKARGITREIRSKITGKKRARDHPLRDHLLTNRITNHIKATNRLHISHNPALWCLWARQAKSNYTQTNIDCI